MKTVPLPPTEHIRLQDLLSYDILDTEKEKDFNDLVELAAVISGCPIAAISFVDKDRQWFKAEQNIGCNETSRDTSFCAHTILQDEVMIIPDARKDERFADSAIVTGELNILFYAGAPIISSAGHKLGSICVMDHVSKNPLSADQQKALIKLASQVSRLLELRARNKLIIQQAAELVEAEKTITRFTISEQETERKNIAYELHENVAQTLAVIKMYLEFAEQSKDRAHYTQKSLENITEIIHDIRNLSNSIVPSTLRDVDCLQLVDTMTSNWGKSNAISIGFIYDKTTDLTDHDTGLAIYRIVQIQLRLAVFYRATAVSIRLEKQDNWILQFSCDGSSPGNADTETAVLIKNIIVRAEAMNGTLSMTTVPDGIISFRVTIPIETLSATQE